ncbi:MAG: hypothetical protein E7K04_00255 [Helicobacter sp.]|nr:hypothetical protein [Helicobacter sp.]
MRVKYFLALALFASLSAEPKIIDGIALTVNGLPITISEIKDLGSKAQLPKDEAINELISQKLRQSEIKRLNIVISNADLDNQVEQIAAQNNISSEAMFAQLAREGESKKDYLEKLKNHMQTQALIRSIILTQGSNIGLDEMQDYYNRHQDEFKIPKTILATRYASSKRDRLEKSISNPNEAIAGVERVNEKIELDAIPVQISQMFLSTKEGDFTPILNSPNNGFISFKIREKQDVKLLSFDDAKNLIAQKLSEDRSNKILQDYFAKIRQKAIIKKIRDI